MSNSRQSMNQPILIAGPTAGGKSALAMALAEEVGGLIINVDSMQVYAELRILTARPSLEDEARVRHALFGHVPANEAYSAGRFLADAAAALSEAAAADLRPIFVGGTGLYFKALLEGLSPIPDIAPDIRQHWRDQASRVGAAALHGVLSARDPDMAARLAPQDTQRIVRALEVFDASGRSLAHWQAQPGEPLIKAEDTVRLVMMPDRDVLHRRADDRFDAMVASGGIEEAARLEALQLDTAFPAMRAIGVAPLRAVARGDMALADASAAAKAETRQYIKRQLTWLSRHMIAWKYISAQEMEINRRDAIAFIQR